MFFELWVLFMSHWIYELLICMNLKNKLLHPSTSILLIQMVLHILLTPYSSIVLECTETKPIHFERIGKFEFSHLAFNYYSSKLQFYSVKMKIFISMRKSLAVLGIESHQSIQTRAPYARSVSILIIFASSAISSYVFFIWKAKNFQEYTNSVNTITLLTVATFNFGVIFWKQNDLIKFIEFLENVVQKSKIIFSCYFLCEFSQMILCHLPPFWLSFL